MASVKYKSLRRQEQPGTARLLNFACFRNQPFLKSDRARAWFSEAMDRAHERHDFDLWAYVLMPDHVHLLLFPRDPVPGILRSVKQSAARRAVAWARAERPGSLGRMRDERPDGSCVHRFWQRGGGYDRNLWEPDAIWNEIEYVHANPVRAGLCEGPEDWAWSSARDFQSTGNGPLSLQTTHLPPQPSRLP